MGKIKHLIVMAAVLTGCLPTMANFFTIGPEAGYEHAGYHSGIDGINTGSGNGFRIGANATYNMANGIFLQSGLYYSHRNGGTLGNIAGKSHFPTFVREVELRRMEYITLPLSIGYEFSLPHGFAIGVSAGGYVAAGVGRGSTYFRLTDGESNGGSLFGKTGFTHYVAETDSREHVTIKESGRIDAGVLVGANVRYNAFELKAYYQIGLNKTIYDIAMPRTFGLALSYNFRIN